jgi:hypothetical protein
MGTPQCADRGAAACGSADALAVGAVCAGLAPGTSGTAGVGAGCVELCAFGVSVDMGAMGAGATAIRCGSCVVSVGSAGAIDTEEIRIDAPLGAIA